MALSGKTLELDSLTTQFLYNRGVPLFSSVTYFPTFSTLMNGAYATWALYPLSTVFYSTFYGYQNFNWFYESINTISTNNTAVSTTLASLESTISAYSTSTTEILITFSNLPYSTLSSLQLNSLFYVSSANANKTTLTAFSNQDLPGLSYWLSIDPPNFLSTNFDTNSNTIIGVAQNKYGYIQLPDHFYNTYAVALHSTSLLGAGIANSTIFTTTTGTTWSEVKKAPEFFASTSIAYNGSYFLAGGLSTTSMFANLAISYDGQSWSTFGPTTNADPPFPTPLSLAWNGSLWVMGTIGGVMNENLFFSEDAIYWSTIAYPSVAAPYVSPQKMQAVYSVAWNGTTFCATGNPVTMNQQPILISEDGKNWYGTDVWYNIPFLAQGFKALPFSNGWLVGGTGNNTPQESVLIHLSSYFGIGTYYTNWSRILERLTNPIFADKVTAMAYNEPLLVIGFESGPPDLYSLAYTSTIQQDATFTTIDSPAFFSNVNDIHFTGDIWLAGGYPKDAAGLPYGSNSYAYSYDGINWTGDGTSTFSTAVFQFLTVDPDPNVNATGSNRIQFGVSSLISTLTFVGYSTPVNVLYPATLSNSSTFWGNYQVSTVSTINNLAVRIINEAPFLIDSGSTLNPLISTTNFELQSSIVNQFYGSSVSTFSTYFFTDFNNFTVPELSTDVTQFSNLTRIQMVTFNNQMFSTYKTNGASNSINTFSNIANTQFIAACNAFIPYNGLPGFERILAENNNVIIPFLNVLSVSTNQNGYVGLSTFVESSLSSFSTQFPFILASSLFYSLRFLNSNISSLSSFGVLQTQSFLTLHDSFITGPQVSSLQLLLSSGISTSFVDYSETLSVPQTIFSNAFTNVNIVPGLCSLRESTIGFFETMRVSTPEVLNFLYTQYPISSQTISFEYSTTYSQIASNLSTYTSSIAYYSTLSSISQFYSSQSVFDTEYVSSQISPEGAFDLTLSSILFIPAQTEQTLYPFYGSTLFFSSFPGISTYFLSNDGTLYRSTFFDFIRTSTVYGDPDFNASFLGIQAEGQDPIPLNLVGGLRLVKEDIASFIVGSSSNCLNATFSNGLPLFRNLYGVPNLQDPIYSYLSSTRLGAVVYNNELLIPSIYELTTPSMPNPNFLRFQWNQIQLPNSFIPDPLVSSVNVSLSTFYNYFGWFAPQLLSLMLPIQYNSANNWHWFSQYGESPAAFNRCVYNDGIGDLSTTSRFYLFPPVDDPVLGLTYSTLGPMTSLTTNGSVYLFTATDRMFSSNYGLTPPPVSWSNSTFNSVYTMVLTSNINLSTATVSEFSTFLQLDTGYVPAIYDSIWTGTSFLVAGNGVFRSQDGLAWSQVLPSTQEAYLGYRSLTTNGSEIYLAEISSAPIYIEVKKSIDDGVNWSYVTSFEMGEFPEYYTDIGSISTSLYTPTIRWGYNKINLAIAPLTNPVSPFRKTFLYQSADDGQTWPVQEITGTGNPDLLTGSPWPDFQTGKLTFTPAQSYFPTIQMSTFEIYANDTSFNPSPDGMALQVYASTIYFMPNISLKQIPTSIQRGLFGINITPTEYALDIGFGDARKPTGSLWISPSDRRIKTDFQTVDNSVLEALIEGLNLVKFQYTESYTKAHGVSQDLQYGFLSQEVKQLFPSAVSVDSRDNIDDFESLNLDQLNFTRFAITKQLLNRISALKSRIESLMR